MMNKWITTAICAAALAVAAPARAQEPTPTRLAAAVRLMVATDMERNYGRTMELMIEQQMRQNPAMARFETIMRAFFSKYLSWRDVRDDMARVYALTYTEDEMRQLMVFYQTPLGRRLLETTPELAARTNEATQRRLMEHMPELTQQIMEQMQANPAAP
jgi:hypothetical protein